MFNEHKTECRVCRKTSFLTTDALGICPDCLRERPEETLPYIRVIHDQSRSRFGLPGHPPKDPDGILCNVCSNQCRIGIGATSYCGLKRTSVDGTLKTLTSRKTGILYSYLDKHVTNCCAAWFCPAGSNTGYPRYAYTIGPEYDYYNLAIFLYGCNFDCLFCQNVSHKNVSAMEPVRVEGLVEETRRTPLISCWCFFGGSPEPQLPFAIEAARTVRAEMPDRILRICFEWNGCGNPTLVRDAAELSLVSGGNIKFDLKAFTPSLSYALSGVSNSRAHDNFKMIAREFYSERPELPVLTATTLLVPGYVEVDEVEKIARFIADLNPEIPYSLLVFHPAFLMTDLPITPLRQVIRCYQGAKKHLKSVHVGNLHLLGMRSMEDLTRLF